MWWGYSSALDLLGECDLSKDDNCCGDGTSETRENDETSVNVLLVGQSDNRHVLKTLSKKYGHEEKVNLNLFICESLLENVARDLLFLVLALEPAENVGLADKTSYFMELYGNTLIRPATSNYLATAADLLLHMITDLCYAEKILPSVKLHKLKYRERDQLEIIFKYWAAKDEKFDILTCWDQRLRKSLGLRYDNRDGVYDWDYHMRYRSFGAETLKMQEYKRFRERGMAFYSEDTDPCIPNRTLASAIFPVGSKIINYGYLGDVVTGPYPNFGFDCEDPRFLEKVNGIGKKSATDVTQNNVMRIFHEIMNKEPFPANDADGQNFAYMTEDTSHRLQIKSLPQTGNMISRKIQVQNDGYKFLSLDRCQIVFLPTTALKDCLNRSKFENFFDLVTFPQVMVLKNFTPDIIKLMKPNGKVIVDTPKYFLNYRKEDLEKFKSDLESLMKECNCKILNERFSYSTDEFMKFQVMK